VTNSIETTSKNSKRNMLFSFLLPGLGQLFAGYGKRGFTWFASVLGLGGLSIWTIAQKARFPDYPLSASIFYPLLLQTIVLLIALVLIFDKWIDKENQKEISNAPIIRWLMSFVYVIALLFLSAPMLSLAGTPADLHQIHQITAVLVAGSLAAFWVWQARDAGNLLEDKKGSLPSSGAGIALLCAVVFFLGYNLTKVNLPKAIIEYEDLAIRFPDIFWPWKNAFEYEVITLESFQKIQAPCPEGATGPAANEILDGQPWVIVSPTCGELASRTLAGDYVLNTEMIISGGGYGPGQEVELYWKNPIGNSFKPRGVGETEITVDENGEFTTTLFMPSMATISTAVGDQIHKLVVVQESDRVFTGNLSTEMILALEKILETIMIGLVATFFGLIFAFPVSFFAARNIMAPISLPLYRIAGGLMGLVLGIQLTGMSLNAAIEQVGGLDVAPIPLFILGLILLLSLSLFGIQLGIKTVNLISTKMSPTINSILTSLIIAALAFLPGRGIGSFIALKVLSIPIGEEAAALFESSYILIGGLLFAIGGFVYGIRNKWDGEISLGMGIYTIVRTIMNVIRSIEPLVWAIICSIWVGLGPFAGTIALALHTVAALGKLYSEAIENIDPGPIEALEATGATRLQTIVYAVIPQILPPFISFTIYRWDINVRMSTVIGLVGGGGIGFLLIQWIRLFQYRNVGLAVWLIAITVTVLDTISSKVREKYI
jgi:phosphonate ABC transporter permease subunit PhnE